MIGTIPLFAYGLSVSFRTLIIDVVTISRNTILRNGEQTGLYLYSIDVCLLIVYGRLLYYEKAHDTKVNERATCTEEHRS